MSALVQVLATGAIRPHLIAAILEGHGQRGGADRQRQLDLARLAWTCRGAYAALHHHLWSTLHLVFRDKGCDSPSSNSKDSAQAAKALFGRHNHNLDVSLFPHYNKGRTSATTAGCHDAREKIKIQRVRTVSEFRYLYPFVVLGGKLYLASLHDKKQPNEPTPAVTTLWDQQDKQTQPLGSRIVGGLVLVPYPLHLVSAVVVDFCDPSMARRFECNHLNSKTDFTAKLPFLLESHLCRQVTSYTLLAVNPRHCIGALHVKLSHAYSAAQTHEWFVRRGGLRPTPSVPPTTQHVRLFNDHAFNAAHPLRAVGVADAQITHFEQYGAGTFQFCWPRSVPFMSMSLETLLLDFDARVATNRQAAGHDHVAYRFHMPVLRRITLTASVAALLFPSHSPHYRFHEPIDLGPAFPALSHLTLLPDHAHPMSASHLPTLPYAHMPNLTHFRVPLHKKTAVAHGRFPLQDLHTLVAHAPHLTSLSIPGVDAFPHISPAIPDAPVLLARLTKAALRTSHTQPLSRLVDMPKLTTLSLIVDSSNWVQSLARHTPALTNLTLHMAVDHCSTAKWWQTLAHELPKLTHLTIAAPDVPEVDRAPKTPTAADKQAGDPLLDIEDLSLGAVAAQEASMGIVAHGEISPNHHHAKDLKTDMSVHLSHLQHLSITHPSASLDCPITMPALKSLELYVHDLDAFSSALPHVDHLVLHGGLTAVAAQYVLNLVQPHANVRLFPRTKSDIVPGKTRHEALWFRFAGPQHAQTWSKVLHASLPSGLHGHGSVKVVLTDTVTDKHARLIAQVVEKLLGKNMAPIRVVWNGQTGGNAAAENVVRVQEAIDAAVQCGHAHTDCEE